MDKKLNDKAKDISSDDEIDADELVHEEQVIPDSADEQDIDELVHSLKKPVAATEDEEQDIDDLMHEEDGEEIAAASSGQ